MVSPTPFTAAERLESLKAAGLGGGAAATIALLIALLSPLLFNTHIPWLWLGLPGLWGGLTFVNGTIAALSGALFALTYRYAVRQDTNTQLKSGVVLAFTLVRGLVRVDDRTAIGQHFWLFWALAASLESLLLFGITGLLLNRFLTKGWIAPFRG
jgi:hypothetical protein